MMLKNTIYKMRIRKFNEGLDSEIREQDLVRLLSHNKWTVNKGFEIGGEYEVVGIRDDFEYSYQIQEEGGDSSTSTWVKGEQIEKIS